jgi:hypothetical protein
MLNYSMGRLIVTRYSGALEKKALANKVASPAPLAKAIIPIQRWVLWHSTSFWGVQLDVEGLLPKAADFPIQR